MDLALAALVTIPGLAFGSFLNVVAARVPLRQSIVATALRVLELWHADRRPRQRPGALLAPAARPLPPLPGARSRRSIRPSSWSPRSSSRPACSRSASRRTRLSRRSSSSLVTLSAIDLGYRIVPNRIVLPAAAIVLVAATALQPSAEWAIAALGASGFLFVAALAYPKGMGMGDVKLALLLGAMLGRSVAVALMIGFLAALVPSAVLFLRHGSKARKMAIPFVPFLAFGAVVALFVGDAILDWYLGIFG